MSDLQQQSAESLVRARRIDAVCDEAEAAWQAGKPPRLEDLVVRFEGAEHLALLGELLALEVYYRRRAQEAVTPDEYRQRFPHLLAETIERAFSKDATPRVSQAAMKHSLSSLSVHQGETLPFAPAQMAQAAEVALPATFGRYQLLKELGRGAMGVVYLARDTQLERMVALKVPQLSGHGQEEIIDRFYREARAAAALRHPHLCPVFDVGKIDGQHFISMAFVEGRPLSKLISSASLHKPRAVAVLIRKVALGLQDAHSHGIVHRDLKPGNIMIDSRGEPTVMDFGLARDFSQKDATKVTQTGMLVGTPAYMSPEQIEGGLTQIGPATDIWSLGVILFELLTGQLPFPGATIFKVVSNIQNLDPQPLAELRPDIPEELAAICHKMMAKSIGDRYASMTDVAVALARIGKQQAPPPPLPPTAQPELLVKTSNLKLDANVIESRQTIRFGMARELVTSVPRWQLIVGGSVGVGMLLLAMTLYSLSRGLEHNTANVPRPSVQPKVEPSLPPTSLQPMPPSPVPMPPLLPAPPPTPTQPTDSQVIFHQQPLKGHVGAVRAVAITADGKFGFSAGGWPNGDAKVRKWNLENSEQLFAFDRHTALVDAVGCDALGRRVLSGSKDLTVRLIDGLTGEEHAVFQGHTRTINMVAVSPDGRWGASTSDDGTVRVWDLDKKEPRGILFGSSALTSFVAISPDSKLVAFGTYDTELVIGELESSRILHRIFVNSTGAGGFSPDGSQFATGHSQGFVLIWDVKSGRLQQRLRVVVPPTTVQFHSDGEHVLVSGIDRRLYFVNIRTGLGNGGQYLAAPPVRRLSIARDKPQLILSFNESKPPGPQLETWELHSPQTKDLVTSYLDPAPLPSANSREIADWIIRVGGRIYLTGSPLPILSVSEFPSGSGHAERVSFDRCPLLPGEIECLLKLNPKRLELGYTQLTDEDLQTIKPLLARVVALKVGHSLITDTGLELLAENRSLGQLDVEFTEVTATALAKVLSNNSPSLMALDSRQLTQEVGETLKRGPRMNALVIYSLADAPVQLAHLRDAEPNGIHLYGDRTTGTAQPCPDLTPLRNAANLTSLQMQSFTFTSEQLQQIVALRQLRMLHFERCNLAADVIRHLQSAMPQCKITTKN